MFFVNHELLATFSKETSLHFSVSCIENLGIEFSDVKAYASNLRISSSLVPKHGRLRAKQRDLAIQYLSIYGRL